MASAKPQLTMIPAMMVFLLFSRPKTWLYAILAMVAWTGLIIVGFGTKVFAEFWAVLTSYGSYGWNSVQAMSGLPRLLSMVGIEVSQAIAVAISGIFLGCVMGIRVFIFRKKLISDLGHTSLTISLVLIFTVNEFCLSLHDYDHSMLVLPLAFCVLLKPNIAGFLILPLLVAARPAFITMVLGPSVDNNLVVSVALLFASVVAVSAFLLGKDPRFPNLKTAQSPENS